MYIMAANETKKCKIIPKKNRFVPDLLIANKRIVSETTMEINKAEIRRAMSFADVFMIGDDGTETLLTPKNFYVSEADETSGDGSDSGTETPPTEPDVKDPQEPDVEETN